MIVVQFNSVEPFIAELKADGGELEDQIVRTAHRRQPPNGFGMSEMLLISATFLRRGQLHRLDAPMGWLSAHTPDDEPSRKVRAKADAATDAIRAAIAEISAGWRDGSLHTVAGAEK